MNIIVNGEALDYSGAPHLIGLLQFMEVNAEQIAVMLNGTVIPKATFADQHITENDRIELLVFAGGG